MCAYEPPQGAGAPLEARIRRFPRVYRKRLRKLAKTSSRLGELTHSFPAAAFAMVSDRGSPLARGEAVQLVKNGAPLAEVARALDLPLWMRRLPPEAFSEPLGRVPHGERFAREVGNLAPQAPEVSAMWLQWVLAAEQACDEEFALWVARQRIWREQPADPAALAPLAAYAWASQHPAGPPSKLIKQRWSAGVGFGKAVSRSKEWVSRVVNAFCVRQGAYHGGWRQTTSVCGFKFQPRTTAEELRREGEIMRNCVGSYAHAVAQGDCLIYAIRKGGSSVATLEVVADRARPGKGRIAQLEAPGNQPAPAKVRHAAETWLARLGDCPLGLAFGIAEGPVDAALWRRAWKAYAEEKGRRADLFGAEEPTRAVFERLNRCLKTLGRLANG